MYVDAVNSCHDILYNIYYIQCYICYVVDAKMPCIFARNFLNNQQIFNMIKVLKTEIRTCKPHHQMLCMLMQLMQKKIDT